MDSPLLLEISVMKINHFKLFVSSSSAIETYSFYYVVQSLSNMIKINAFPFR